MVVAEKIETGKTQGNVFRYIISDNDTIAKGDLLIISGATTRQACPSFVGSTDQAFAGIASTEKVAGDGQIDIGVWTEGIFDITCDIIVNHGQLLKVSGLNTVSILETTDQLVSGMLVGKALETSDKPEVINVKLGMI